MSLKTEEVDYILQSQLDLKDAKFISCENKSIDDIAMGFFSSSEKVSITYNSQGTVRELAVFIKRLPTMSSRVNEVILAGFQKEVSIYNFFLNNIKLKECVPKCYLATDEGLIVMEDLSSRGYRNLPLLEPLDWVHCEKFLHSLARLHAASFIYEKVNKCKLNEHIPDLDKEVLFPTDLHHPGRKRYSVGKKALKKLVEVYLPHYSENTVSRAFSYMDTVPTRLDPSMKFPNALSHSDIWPSNVMFRYDKDCNVVDSCIIDFQCASYRPPTFDMQLFVFCCTDKKMRNKHLSDLMAYYYSKLKEELFIGGVDVEEIIGWQRFNEMWNYTLPLALVIAPQFMHFVAVPDNILKPILNNKDLWDKYYKQDRDDIVLEAAEKSQQYKDKVLEGLTDLLDYFERVEYNL